MNVHKCISIVVAMIFASGLMQSVCHGQPAAPLPSGVKAVWDLDKAVHQTTSTRQRISINGLWRWQPADAKSDRVPDGDWGYFKVPGCWPGTTNYMQKDCQTVYAHRNWQDKVQSDITAAWYQREITIPMTWAGRRIVVSTEYLNSYAAVYLDGKRIGEMRFPAGVVDLSASCRPGERHILSMLVVAMPLRGVMLSYNDTNTARQIKGSVARRGLCGDVYLASAPASTRLVNVKVETSVRKWEITFVNRLAGLSANASYSLRALISMNGRHVHEFTSKPFKVNDITNGRMAFTDRWHPTELWDTHTPKNQYVLTMSLLDAGGNVLDTSFPTRFGFREFWIEGKDFYLNGTRVFLSAVPLDNAQIGAAWATYARARESLKRLQSFGINAVYTHNYGCQPGDHLGFAEILRAADDVGMLVSFSQPHFAHYDWDAKDADRTNGYARHAAFYVRVAQNHPSVTMYSMSHNATGYSEDMNPDLIDGIHDVRTESSRRNARRALQAEAIVRTLDPTRIVYHHSSGNLGSMHTCNFYPNWVPIQEMSDWLEHWATKGVKPFFTCEYGAPFMWDWAMYRGWYKGHRTFGSAAVPWDFCLAEWNAQLLGDQAYRISEMEKANLRWEAKQFQAGKVWHRWDYPYQLGSRSFDERYPVLAAYLKDNWRAFRTWGVSAISPWEHGVFWKLRPAVDRNRRVQLPTDWQNLQRPGFSPDYLEDRYERRDLAYQLTDWGATPAADAMFRNNGPLLAYLAGKPSRFTSKDHNCLPGETVEKQIIVINNSRETVHANCAWSLGLPQAVTGTKQVTVETGQQKRIALRFDLPVSLKPGTYDLNATIEFSNGESQADRFAIDVLPSPTANNLDGAQTASIPTDKIALFDPIGETDKLLATMGIRCQSVRIGDNLSRYDVLIIGKAALTPEGPAPNIMHVRDGLKVIVFEQTSEALERRLGFRVQEYGLRQAFSRVSDHPYLAGLADRNLRDWRGTATIMSSRLSYGPSNKYNGVPVVRWCGLPVPRLWRCGNRGNVASVLIEKPAIGDFLPIIDGGFSLQYSPLLEYREGKGMVLFCQMDVTGRTAEDPAANRLVRNILSYVVNTAYPLRPTRRVSYVGNAAGKLHLQHAGIVADSYEGGELSPDRVLVVGRGGGPVLASYAPSVTRWLKAGGRLLAVELDAKKANAFLPTPVQTTMREHIATFFSPPGFDSPFAGVGPADVHNRDPRELPLVSGGAKPLGNGVLAQSNDGHIIFCQLAPYTFINSGTEPWAFIRKTEQQNLRKTFRKSSFLLTRLLANMGVRGRTPLLSRFSTPAGSTHKKSVVKNGNFRLPSDKDGMPDHWTFSKNVDQATCVLDTSGPGDFNRSLRITCPEPGEGKKASLMLVQQNVPSQARQWYHISLKAKASGLEGTRITLALQDTTTWRSLIDYQRFAPTDVWKEFVFLVRAKATTTSKTRFQIWYGKAGTVWLSDIRMSPCAPPSEGRWTTGLYLDMPQEWDDPYRFFRW